MNISRECVDELQSTHCPVSLRKRSYAAFINPYCRMMYDSQFCYSHTQKSNCRSVWLDVVRKGFRKDMRDHKTTKIQRREASKRS